MPRKRTPSPELAAQDRQIVAGAALAIEAIGQRYNNQKLALAAELAHDFVNGATPQPQPRTRKPKPVPLVVEIAETQG